MYDLDLISHTDYDFVDFDERDARDQRDYEALREVVTGRPARPGIRWEW